MDSYSSGWSTTGSGGSVTQQNGAVTVVDGTTSHFFMTKKNFTPPAGAFTFELRAKANAAGTENEVTVRSGSYNISLFLPYGISGAAQDRESNPVKTITLDTTVYHTYRIVAHADFTYDLYVDDELAWSGAASSGDGTGSVESPYMVSVRISATSLDG